MTVDSGRGHPEPAHLWSIREDVLLEDDPEHDRLIVLTTWGEVAIESVDEKIVATLRRMSLGPISLENVIAGWHTGEEEPLGPEEAGRTRESRDRTELRQVLDLLSGSVVRSLGPGDGEGPLLSAVPIARVATLRLPEIDPDRPLRLSRFAAIRCDNAELLLESPLAQYHILLHRQLAAQVTTALCAATSAREIATRLPAEPAVVTAILSYLAGAGVVLLGDRVADDEARFAEDDDPVLLRWSHHDLLFHTRSRMGRYRGQSGAVYPLADRLPTPELVKPVKVGPRFPLHRPDIDELIATDPPLTELLENAKLCDDLTDRRLTATQVGELLFRAARIRSVTSESTGTDVRYEVSDRPYLSVYGLYELELYVSLHNCPEIPRGTYHYDPRQHALTLVNGSEPELDELLDSARVAARTELRPPALLTMTARVARTSWMFEGIGYSLALTHVGALQQTLCLVANSMGLAACAPAVDPSDIVNSALRLDWPAEVGVGEFLVG